MKRILIFELNWLGDILFSFPFLRSIREANPDAYIACAVVPRYSELLVNNPYINEIIFLSDSRGITAFFEKLFFIFKIKAKKFDTSFLLKPSRVKAFMAKAAGIKERVGFLGKKDDITLKVEPPRVSMHRISFLLELAKVYGIKVASDRYEYFISEDNIKSAEKILFKKIAGIDICFKNFIVLNPGGNWGPKRWPSKNFVFLGQRILDAYPDFFIVITGASKDKILAESIIKQIDRKNVLNIAGITGLNTLAAIFKKARLVISADSGPMHLASSVGTQTIALFGPTLADLTGPRGIGKNYVIQHNLGCVLPCYEVKCPRNVECMTSVTPEEVFIEVRKALSV
ncbi:lipopolysaccharide heptosyltransferase II [Candidatus Omnitrophus magneticus]|uniref:Lipopolysaccharide heptosyltransferase II n=1 Tax=Candidatus Omnitrophus magneticus TaxID=1609969 RepID=A0A0F0CST0_9BACT|nr:lipopolysaccharide heptosyltransferase II [Candidatus Omnitrophus magneticus]